MKRFIKDVVHYLPLIGVLIAGTLGFIIFSYDRFFQIAIAIAMALSYISWGVVHHLLHDDLYLEVIIEYIVYATLGLVVIFSIIFRS